MSKFKKTINVIKTILLSLPFLGLTNCRFLNGDERKSWNFINNFVCYYGKGEIETLQTFDVAIIETQHFSKDDILKINKKGTWVIGYISLGETSTLDKNDHSYYFDKNGDGTPDCNGDWNSWYVDARSEIWEEKVFENIIQIIEEKQCDGIFLDTIDTVDHYPESKEGMIALIKKIRNTYPHIKIVANRGFTIIEQIMPSIDGVMFESFTTRYNNDIKEYRVYGVDDMTYVNGVAKKLNHIRGSKPIFALDYVKNERDVPLIKEIKKHAKKFRFIPAIATRDLNTVLTIKK